MLFALRNVIIATSPNLVLLLAGISLRGIAYGLMTAVITLYVSYYLQNVDQVMGQTMIVIMTNGVGSTLGNFCGGWAIDNMGLQAMIYGTMVVSIIGAVIILIASSEDRIQAKTSQA